jgi:hypothetical protein
MAPSVLLIIEAITRNGLAKRITFIRIIEAVFIPQIYVPTSSRYINLDTKLLEEVISENITQSTSYLKKLLHQMRLLQTF